MTGCSSGGVGLPGKKCRRSEKKNTCEIERGETVPGGYSAEMQGRCRGRGGEGLRVGEQHVVHHADGNLRAVIAAVREEEGLLVECLLVPARLSA
jgi:hypothetical protein